jgi:hypothetical protein
MIEDSMLIQILSLDVIHFLLWSQNVQSHNLFYAPAVCSQRAVQGKSGFFVNSHYPLYGNFSQGKKFKDPNFIHLQNK